MLLTSFAAVGSTVTITGPEDESGAPCAPNAGHCIIGGVVAGFPFNIYQPFSASITSPSSPGGLWALSIMTNYGATLPGPAGNLIPDYPYLTTSANFGIGDFLISWNGTDYAIVLENHDGYTAGNLYKASSFQTSAQVLQAGGIPLDEIPRPSLNVDLGPMGMFLDTGALSVAVTGDGVNTARYTITDTFSAPTGFLDSAFSVFFSTYACANGFLTGTNGGFTGGSQGTVPEPGSWLLMVPGLVVLTVGQMRKRRRA